MNWYKKANISFENWLSEKVKESTDNYTKSFNPTPLYGYYGRPYDDSFNFPAFLSLLRYWNQQTNPDLSKYDLRKAFNEAKEWIKEYNLPESLSEKDINIDKLYNLLHDTDHHDSPLIYYRDTLKIEEIKKETLSVEGGPNPLVPNTFYRVIFTIYKYHPKSNTHWKDRYGTWTTDGEYFTRPYDIHRFNFYSKAYKEDKDEGVGKLEGHN